jgi:TolA-binding protein
VQASAGDSAQVKKLEDQIRQLKAEIKRLEDERMSDAQRYGTLQKQYN